MSDLGDGEVRARPYGKSKNVHSTIDPSTQNNGKQKNEKTIKHKLNLYANSSL